MMYILLIIGFALLVKGADYFVDGSSSVAKLLNVPPLIIGLTIVAMGTSAPEASVSITAAIGGISGLSVGNIIGSNIFNLLVVIGISAALKPFKTDPDILKRDLPFNAAITLLLPVCCLNGVISRIEGLLFVLIMAIYIIFLIRSAINGSDTDDEIKVLSPVISAVYIIGGLAAVIYGGNIVVDSAKKIAASFGLSDAIIGLTVVAIGTSLPELVTSIVAARKGQSDLSLGNAVGSCIFNILFILGASSLVNPNTVEKSMLVNCAILLCVSVLLWIAGLSKKRITRTEGIICTLLYVGYTAYLLLTI